MDRNVEIFNEIYSSYSKKIYNIAYKITGDKMIAEDITHDTFTQVYQKYETFRGESGILTWIYTIAKNNCFQYLRKVKRVSFLDIDTLIDTAGKSDQDAGYSDIEKDMYVEQVKEGCLLGLLRCLSFHQRVSFILHVLYEIPIEETSQIIAKSPNATRILIHRARSNLKTFLCKNCSLYNKNNRCTCENLISFSLNRGWINKNSSPNFSAAIESELHDFKSEILLYKTLNEYDIPVETVNYIANLIKNKDFYIFSDKKVK
jgi:RNA polymerase sigma factor (sigma-70 family)